MNTVHHPATPHTIAQSQTSSTDRPTNEDAKIHRLAKRLFVIIGEWWQSVKTAVSTIVQRTHRSPEPQATTTAQRTDNASHDVIAQQGNPIPPQGSPPTTRVLTQEERRNQDENTKMREALLPLFQSFGRVPPLEGLERSHLRWLTRAHVQLSEALASASYEQIQKAEEQLNAFDETIRQVSQQERAFEQQYKNDREKLGSELDAIAKLPQPEYLRQTEQQETLDREKLNQAREKLEQARENFAGVVRGSPEELDKAQGQLTTAQKEFQQASEQFKTAREKATKARKRWNEDLASKKEAISKKYSLETRREDHENSEVMRTGRFNTRLSGHPVFRLMRAAIQEQAQQVHQLKNAFENARTALRLETSLQMPEEEHSFQAFQERGEAALQQAIDGISGSAPEQLQKLQAFQTRLNQLGRNLFAQTMRPRLEAKIAQVEGQIKKEETIVFLRNWLQNNGVELQSPLMQHATTQDWNRPLQNPFRQSMIDHLLSCTTDQIPFFIKALESLPSDQEGITQLKELAQKAQLAQDRLSELFGWPLQRPSNDPEEFVPERLTNLQQYMESNSLKPRWLTTWYNLTIESAIPRFQSLFALCQKVDIPTERQTLKQLEGTLAQRVEAKPDSLGSLSMQHLRQIGEYFQQPGNGSVEALRRANDAIQRYEIVLQLYTQLKPQKKEKNQETRPLQSICQELQTLLTPDSLPNYTEVQLQHIKALLPSIEKLLPSTASQAVDNTLSQRAQAQQALQTFQSTVRSLRESYQFDEKTFQQLQIFDTIANTAQTLTQNEAVQQLQTIITTLYRAQPTKKQEGMLMDLTKVFDTNESRQQAARTKIKSAIDQCADSMKSTLLQHLNTLEPTLRPIKPILPTL